MQTAKVLEFPKSNPIQESITIKKNIKLLQAKEKELKQQIHQLMDEAESDKLFIDEFSAERKLIVQERVDTPKCREVLGKDTPMKEVEIIKLEVI